MYTKTDCHVRLLRTMSMRRWNVTGLLDRPIGSEQKRHCPRLVMNAVLSRSASASGTW